VQVLKITRPCKGNWWACNKGSHGLFGPSYPGCWSGQVHETGNSMKCVSSEQLSLLSSIRCSCGSVMHEWAWQGYHVWAKLIEACADLGYGPVNLVSAPPPCPAAKAAEL